MRRLLLTAFLGLSVLLAGAISMGPPRLVVAAGFFAGGAPSLYQGEAVVVLLAWLAIAGLVLLSLVQAVHDVVKRQPSEAGAISANLLLVAGVLVLGVALIHRALPTDSMCCGPGVAPGLDELVQLAR